MENHDYGHHHHHHSHNNTKMDMSFGVNVSLLITILITFVSLFIFLLVLFLLLHIIKNYSNICDCTNTPCIRKKRMEGIEIEMGSLSHTIINEKKITRQ
tara:strand:+ start:19 stop:315 length:297 start_codon:yes stop_codon:yes gene_type:complete